MTTTFAQPYLFNLTVGLLKPHSPWKKTKTSLHKSSGGIFRNIKIDSRIEAALIETVLQAAKTPKTLLHFRHIRAIKHLIRIHFCITTKVIINFINWLLIR